VFVKQWRLSLHYVSTETLGVCRTPAEFENISQVYPLRAFTPTVAVITVWRGGKKAVEGQEYLHGWHEYIKV